MAQLVLKYQIPDDVSNAVIRDCAQYLGYQAKIPDPAFVPTAPGQSAPLIDNPQTRKQFLEVKVLEFIKNCYISQKAAEADSARKDAVKAAELIEMLVIA